MLLVRTERHDSDKIFVAVEDSGPGIDPKKLGGIFDAFVSTKPQGMGLGLAICRMIIERHGGQLSAWSGKKRGAVFQSCQLQRLRRYRRMSALGQSRHVQCKTPCPLYP
jgi:signal transduction histidine kinase